MIYIPKGVCTRKIEYDVDANGIIHNVRFTGGCPGNLQGIAALVEGMKVEDVVKRLDGIQCRMGTSCPDQLAKALKKVLANN